jgi:hypothetical protein
MNNWLLERKLKKLGHKADPDPAFLRALEKQLKQKSGHGAWWIQGWKFALGGVTAVSLLSGATGVYAYSSDDVTPDHPLYGVRTTIEDVEMTLATTPEQKARVKINHLERRVHEQKTLQSKHKTVLKEVIQNIEKEVDSQIDENGALATSTRQEMDEKLGKIEDDHAQLLKFSTTSTKEVGESVRKFDAKIEKLDEGRKQSLQKHRDEGNRRDENDAPKKPITAEESK